MILKAKFKNEKIKRDKLIVKSDNLEKMKLKKVTKKFLLFFLKEFM